MPLNVKPGTVFPTFSSGGTNNEWPAGLITSGYSSNSIPAYDHFNWAFNNNGLWIAYLNALDGTNVVRSSTDATTVDQALNNAGLYGDLWNDYVLSGGTAPTSASLVTTMVTCVAYANGRRTTSATSPSITVTASKDTYVDMVYDGTLTLVPVTNGAGAPGLTSNAIRLMKLVSNGTAITTSTDLRTLAPTFKPTAPWTLPPIAEFNLLGDVGQFISLSTFPNFADVAYNSNGARTITKVVLTCPNTGPNASGTIVCDILLAAVGAGSATTIYSGAKPTITCTGASTSAQTVQSGGSLPTTVIIPDLNLLYLQVTAAVAGCRDLKVQIF